MFFRACKSASIISLCSVVWTTLQFTYSELGSVIPGTCIRHFKDTIVQCCWCGFTDRWLRLLYVTSLSRRDYRQESRKNINKQKHISRAQTYFTRYNIFTPLSLRIRAYTLAYYSVVQTLRDIARRPFGAIVSPVRDLVTRVEHKCVF